jgi:hypothetical protein
MVFRIAIGDLEVEQPPPSPAAVLPVIVQLINVTPGVSAL